MERAQLHNLKLVCEPISNRNTEINKKNTDLQQKTMHSNLYMICQRKEILFLEPKIDDDKILTLNFAFKGSNDIIDSCEINLLEILDLELDDFPDSSIEFDYKSKSFRIVKKENKEIIFYSNIESLLYNKWHKTLGIYGLDNYTAFTEYDLLYIGMSQKNSFNRLIENAHETRISIISQQQPKNAYSQLTDEIYFLFFTFESIEAKILRYNDNGNIEELFNNQTMPTQKVITDAEKAFIHYLKPPYNEKQYLNYPKSTDGLCKENLNRYGFMISEDITLKTDSGSFKGSVDITKVDVLGIEGNKFNYHHNEKYYQNCN